MSMGLGAERALVESKYRGGAPGRKCPPREASIARIMEAMSNGAASVDELAEHTGIKPKTLENLCYDAGISLRKYRPKFQPKHESAIDRLLDGYHSMDAIAELTGRSAPTIRHYLARTDQYDLWKTRREQRKNPQQIFSSLVSVLKTRCIQLAYEQGWAYGKAEEVVQTRRKLATEHGYTPAQLVDFFSAYEEAAKEGRKLSVYDLHQLTEVRPEEGYKLLARFDLRSLVPGKPSKPCDPARIVQAYDLGLSQTDIAYFAQLSKTRVRTVLLDAGRGMQTRVIKRFNIHGTRTLDYRLASQVYEAQDAGYFSEFSGDQIACLLDTKEPILEHARRHREALAPTIVEALRVLHPARDLRAPYLTAPRCEALHSPQSAPLRTREQMVLAASAGD